MERELSNSSAAGPRPPDGITQAFVVRADSGGERPSNRDQKRGGDIRNLGA
jgi:hypothetical protein